MTAETTFPGPDTLSFRPTGFDNLLALDIGGAVIGLLHMAPDKEPVFIVARQGIAEDKRALVEDSCRLVAGRAVIF